MKVTDRCKLSEKAQMKMKKQLIIIAIFTILFISCTGFFELREEVEIIGISLYGKSGS